MDDRKCDAEKQRKGKQMQKPGSKKVFWTIWIATAVSSFFAFYIGVAWIAKSMVLPRNFLAYIIVSILFGGAASVLYLLRWKIACACYLAGIFAGFCMMYRAFSSNLSGWEDLAGLMSLFFGLLSGLFLGAVLQFGYWLWLRLHQTSSK